MAAFCQAILFLMSPTMAVTIAPATPPPTAWPTKAPMSVVPAAPVSAGISAVRSWPPATPPIAPAIELPVGPRLTSFRAAPAPFPPIAPAISWMTRLIRVSDIASPLVLHLSTEDEMHMYGEYRTGWFSRKLVRQSQLSFALMRYWRQLLRRRVLAWLLK